MISYPNIDPVAFTLGPLKVHWYGLMYLLGFFGAWILLSLRAKKPGSPWTLEQVSDIVFYCALGVIVGGRVGYVLFYDFSHFMAAPWSLFEVWQGGMSFHGGLLGVLGALWIYSWRHHVSFVALGDFIVPVVPIGLGAGRIGNFINGELWGTVSSVPWAMVFPSGGPLPRHPSQLYEFLLEGLCLFTILWIYSSKPRPPLAVGSLFFWLYGVFRFFCEFFRTPDVQWGYFFGGWLTMGQILSIPMIIMGLFFWIRAQRRDVKEGSHGTIS